MDTQGYRASLARGEMRLGNVDLFVCTDGTFTLDGGALFGVVPRVLWKGVLPPDELNRVPMALNCLLIVSEGKRILVDTGFGAKLSQREREIHGLQRGEGDLLQAIGRLGYLASDIDIVINTHLHPDHCGGNTSQHDGLPTPTFPNAEYWIQRQEWADACSPNERTRKTYLAKNLVPLGEAHELRLLDGDARVTDQVRCVVTRGHTRGHQSVVVESGGEAALFLGDLAPKAVHLERLAWTTAFDTEPLETVEAKRAWRDWALENDAVLFFGHDGQTPVGRLRVKSGHFRVDAL